MRRLASITIHAGGRTMRALKRTADKDWEESKHPRDEEGKFSETAGGGLHPEVKSLFEKAKASGGRNEVSAKWFRTNGQHAATESQRHSREGNKSGAAESALRSASYHSAANALHPQSFSAAEYAAGQDDPEVTPESIMAKLTPEQRAEVEQLHHKIAAAGQTIEKHRDEKGSYSQERAAIHDMILFQGRAGRDPDDPRHKKWYPGILDPQTVAKAKPPAGQQPTFTILGGRGGSGKSKFEGSVYEKEHAIVLDADVIKHMIEEFEGWNANEVHEESSDILETALRISRELGLNVVFDATMKSSGGALEKVDSFKKAGYRVEAHYMHLPRQIAAERATQRYFSPSQKSPELRGRYVPPHVVLGNRMNEANFDQVRQLADRWSFMDNNVPRGAEPRLIARGGYGDDAATGGPSYPMAPQGEWYGDANYQSTGGRLEHMSPDDYLRQTRPMDPEEEAARDNINDLKQHMRNGGRLDPLALYASGKEDGRHRAHAARELGIRQVPVLNWRQADA